MTRQSEFTKSIFNVTLFTLLTEKESKKVGKIFFIAWREKDRDESL